MALQYFSCSAKSNVLKYFQPYNITEETWNSLTNDTECRPKANCLRKQPDSKASTLVSVAARQATELFLDWKVENEPVRGTAARKPEHPPCLRIGRQDTTFELADRSGTKNPNEHHRHPVPDQLKQPTKPDIPHSPTHYDFRPRL